MKPTVPPEPAPPTLDPAIAAECVRTLNDQAERLYAMMEAQPIGSEKRKRLSLRASEWFAAAARIRAFAAAAAPPTVAPAWPAREVAHEVAGCTATLMSDPVAHSNRCNAMTTAIERDRTSRSPGPTVALPGLLHGACIDPACRAYWEHQIAAITAHREHNAPVWAELDRLAQQAVDLSASAGLEGAKRREGLELKSESSGGLDAATVEACAAEAEAACERGHRSGGHALVSGCDVAARIRALATPPGQTKP